MRKSEEKKLARRYEKCMKHGWNDIVKLTLLPEFVTWMGKQGFRLVQPEGDDLLVFKQDGQRTHIWWNEAIRRCCTDRAGMGLWIVFEGRYRWEEQHEQTNRVPKRPDDANGAEDANHGDD